MLVAEADPPQLRLAGADPLHVLGDELDRDFAAESGVLAAIHHAHAAGAKLSGDPVMGERSSNHLDPVAGRHTSGGIMIPVQSPAAPRL